MKANTKLYYIGRRDNPQLSKPYFNDYGQLTKREALKKEDCAYGSMVLTGYETIEGYECAKIKIVDDGFMLTNCKQY